jgi:hypothetical protein
MTAPACIDYYRVIANLEEDVICAALHAATGRTGICPEMFYSRCKVMTLSRFHSVLRYQSSN